MDIKKLANSVLIFTIKRLIEIIGILVSILGFLLFVSLISYSPTDPNFIFSENTKIKNILGFHGSYTSDLFFQSTGVVAYLIPVTYMFAGINIFKKKEAFLLIQCTFFVILYSSTGSLFFSFFYNESFIFYINGNGGFIGNFFNEISLKNILQTYDNFFYYSLIS